MSNGVITLNLNETCHVYNRTELSRLNIRVINKNALFPDGQPLDALIKVEDEEGPLVNLISIATRDGYAFGAANDYDIPFWFLKNRNYTFRLDVLNYTNVGFNVTTFDTGNVSSYEHLFNMSMTIEFNVIFEQEVEIELYDTAFFNVSGTDQVQWEEDLTYFINFTYTIDNGTTWNPVMDPEATCKLTITLQGYSEVLLTRSLIPNGDGTFEVTINSNLLSAGYSYRTYTIKIIGNKPGYPPPNEIFLVSTITALPAGMSAHDYDTLISLPLKEYVADFNELINITVRFFESGTNLPLYNSLLTYEWLNLDPMVIQPDPINDEYYTFTLDTSDALSTGIESIKIYAYLENHTLNNSPFEIELTITERSTKLNGQVDPQPISTEIWIEDTEYFVFTYTDYKTDELIGDLNIATYNWYEMDDNGSFLNTSGGGSLIENINTSYTLDYDTGERSEGYYLITVSLKKNNYLRKQITLLINIKLREMEYEFNSPNIRGNRINVVHGETIDFEINLIDISRGGIKLVGANVILALNSKNYTLTETLAGIYSFSLETSQFDAFFTAHILSGTLEIRKANFTTQEMNINIVIGMEEIFPGMPTFYFILIVTSILGITGSLVAYRVIHYARIPKYVKKIMKVRKVIKSKKKFIEQIKVPSKEKMIVQLFGDDWKALGISLNKQLDVKGKDKLMKKDKINKEMKE